MHSKDLPSSSNVRTFPRPLARDGQPARVPEYYACNVFDIKAMSKRLSKQDVDTLTNVMLYGGKIDAAMSDRVAMAVKEWAIEKGATHYCHWFQPQTGTTAEKHSAFLAFDSAGQVLEQFCSSELSQSEPDASSFPSGGMRSTFEARGYTGWDPSSPMFVMETETGRTLYIPSVFVSYHGDALDFKVPLLRSNESVGQVAVRTLELLGEKQLGHVTVTIGPEQEFFVVDREVYRKRPDLRLTGRTVLGKAAAKGQELDDHYFANIPIRVQAFMNEVEVELYKVGVPVHTRHNEVAPGQFELAPIFETANIASDHNQLLMKILHVVAARHGLAVLLHEKPFQGVNGSGKHVNWSIQDSQGRNLLKPGQTPEQNLIFLTFLAGFMQGICDHADVLRASIATAGNDHRLGANEAPPAIMSIFLGQRLTEIVDALATGKKVDAATGKSILSFGVKTLQDMTRDTTDRNRTSPIAFTGNKFEFRAVGSSASISYPTTIMNAAIASGLEKVNTKIAAAIGNSTPCIEQILPVLREVFQSTQKIRFEGNGYSNEWRQEAETRRLGNFATTPAALNVLSDEKSTQFLINQKIFTREDIESRLAVQQERYIKQRLIEINIALEMVETGVLPAGLAWANEVTTLAMTSQTLNLGSTAKNQAEIISNRLGRVEGANQSVRNLLERFNGTDPLAHENLTKSALFIAEQLLPKLDELRAAVDSLEACFPETKWPFPHYQELLFGLE